MANAVYPLYKEALLSASASVSLNVDTSTDGPFVALSDTGVTAYSAAHDFYDDVDQATVGTPQVIDNPTVTAGTLDGADVTFTSVSGAQCEALIIYRHNSGADTTWRLVVFLDTSQTGLPVTPNGGNISVTWNASGIFTISDREVKEDGYRGSKQRHTGFMAQEIEQIVPSAVREIGGRKRVNYASALAGLERVA